MVVGAGLVGGANSIVWEFSQIGGFVVIFVFEGVGSVWGWTWTFWLSGILTLLGAVSALGLASP